MAGEVAAPERAPPQRRQRLDMRGDRAARLQVAELDVRRRGADVEQREPHVEERVERALGEIALEEAARMRAGLLLLRVGAAVAVGIAARAVCRRSQRSG